MDPDEYTGGSFTVHLIAGAAAGTAEHCGMFPIDTVKTHIQAIRPGAIVPTPIAATKEIIARSGVRGLFRGITAMAAGSAPAHALHFAVYEAAKQQLVGELEGHHPFRVGLAGFMATVVSDGVLAPMDAVKQRMQLHATPYKGMVDCINTVFSKGGIRAFYAGYTTTLVMNGPYHAVYFAGYESLLKLVRRDTTSYDPLAHCLAGGGAGMLAAGVTNPFDVAKTRLQTQGEVGTGTHKYRGMVNTVATIWKEEGVSGFSRGIVPRMVFHSMSAAICWSVYEYMKRMLDRFEKAE
jgi:solute carrier family 25 iron transporter 28/37